jgi:hypothetical protein
MSCDEFYGWGLAKLDIEHTQLKQGTHPQGHVYTYSPLARVLLTQLEIQPQDQPFAALAALNADLGNTVKAALDRPSQGSGMSMEDAVELGRKLAMAEQRVKELEGEKEAAKQEKPLHWKTREKLEKEAKEG